MTTLIEQGLSVVEELRQQASDTEHYTERDAELEREAADVIEQLIAKLTKE